jgi:radical SAM-linked protein
MELFSMAFIRAKIPVFFSKGFNPLPRLDFASPLAMGIEGENEIAAVDTAGYYAAEMFKTALNARLPQGFKINTAVALLIPRGVKKHSLASLLWGYGYENVQKNETDLIRAQDEKAYRLSRGVLYGLKRKLILAKALSSPEQGKLYFDVYRELYGSL